MPAPERIVIPREHGAWAMLLVPFVVGAASVSWEGIAPVRVALGLAGVLCLFTGRAPLSRLIRRRRRRGSFRGGSRTLWLNFALFSAAGLSLIIMAVPDGGYVTLALLAGFGLALFLVQTWLALALGERSIPAELSGIVLLTMTAPLAAFLARGEGFADAQPALLWLINAMYFGASVFNVKMKVASKVERREHFTLGRKLLISRRSVAYLALVAAVWIALAAGGYAPVLAPAAFLPVAVYVVWSIATMSSRVKIRVEGFVQLGLSLGFAVIVIAAWRLAA